MIQKKLNFGRECLVLESAELFKKLMKKEIVILHGRECLAEMKV